MMNTGAISLQDAKQQGTTNMGTMNAGMTNMGTMNAGTMNVETINGGDRQQLAGTTHQGEDEWWGQ